MIVVGFKVVFQTIFMKFLKHFTRIFRFFILFSENSCNISANLVVTRFHCSELS